MMRLASTPPMGWNSWNTFTDSINEKVVRETADAMVESGLKDAGYEYVIIDDCWAERNRDGNGRLVPDREKFPSGMKALADYIHSKGLKFGIYSCCGPLTCAVYPGSFDYEFEDAATFAEWGVDYLKYDSCFMPKVPIEILYSRMNIALRATGRDIFFAACGGMADISGGPGVEKWIRSAGGHSYRSTLDIRDNWGSLKRIALSQIPDISHSGTYCFNDMDMLVVGMRGKSNSQFIIGGDVPVCTDIEYRTHFAFWCMMNSALIMGCDVRDLDEGAKKILMNRDLIAINQDPECRPPRYIGKSPENPGEAVCLMRMLSGGDVAIGFFNLSDRPRTMSKQLFDLGLGRTSGKWLKAYDCVTQSDAGCFSDTIIQRIDAHDCRVFRCKVIDPPAGVKTNEGGVFDKRINDLM